MWRRFSGGQSEESRQGPWLAVAAAWSSTYEELYHCALSTQGSVECWLPERGIDFSSMGEDLIDFALHPMQTEICGLDSLGELRCFERRGPSPRTCPWRDSTAGCRSART